MKGTPAEDAKSYMSSRQVPQLFESLMTGLMFHRPDDHLSYLIECLHKVKESGCKTVNWNAFVEIKRSNTLPPISPTPRTTSSEDADCVPPISKDATKDITKASPLPPIGKSRESSTANGPIKFPITVPIILIMGPPGCGKLTQSQLIVQHYTKYKWAHVSMGDLLRENMLRQGGAEKKWQVVSDLVRKGEMAPEDVTQSLVREVLNSHLDADGILIEGYPRTMEQVDEFNRLLGGRVDLVIYLECAEELCQQRLMARRQNSDRVDDNEMAVKRRVDFFRKNTLPVVRYFDTEGKIVPLSADRDSHEVSYDIINILDVAFYGRQPASVIMQPSSKPSPAASTLSSRKGTETSSPPGNSFIMMCEDEGRKKELPQAPIIFIMGGPGCGKGAQSQKLVERFPGVIHISMGDILRSEISTHGTADEKISMLCDLIYNGELAPHELTAELLLSSLIKHKTARAFLVEGFPRGKNQLEDFYNQIGGLERAILLDCEESTLRKNVEERRETSERQDDRPAPLQRRIDSYRTQTLPLAKYLGDHNKLTVLAVEGRSVEDVHTDLSSELNYILHRDSSSASSKTADETKDQVEVAEEIVAPEAALTTGGTGVSLKQPSDLSKQATNISKQSSGSSDSTQSSDSDREPTELSKEPTKVSKEPTEPSKEPTSIDKQPSDIGKEPTELSKQPSDVSKQSTNVTEDKDMAEQLKGKKVIFVVGGPGCGKGTQCAKIVDKYGFCHLSSGDLLREEVQSGSARGKELNAIMESGALVSLDVVLTLLTEAMLKNASAKGFLIDGYPRELEQGTRFEAEIQSPACVLYFEVPDEVMVGRLLERAKTSGRVDDNEETIQKRLKTFHDHCDKVLSHYEGKGLLCKIDAKGQVDDIFGEVVKRIDSTN